VAGSCEHGDEPLASGATKLVCVCVCVYIYIYCDILGFLGNMTYTPVAFP
jgi:hypothetical protein